MGYPSSSEGKSQEQSRPDLTLQEHFVPRAESRKWRVGPLGLEVATLYVLGLVFFAVQVLFAARLPLDFDSSYNLLMSRTLAETGRYATSNFSNPGQEFFPFDTWVTTGYPVLALAGSLWKLTGVSEVVARSLMTLWGAGFLWLSYRWVTQTFPEVSRAVLAIYVLSVFYLLDMQGLAVHTLGELPAAFFLLVAMLLYRRGVTMGSAYLLGLCLGLSAVTKLMMVFAALPLGMAYIAVCAKYTHRSAVLLAIAGGLTPFLVQALWIQSQMPLHEWILHQRVTWATQNAGLIFDAWRGWEALFSRLGTLASRDPIYAFAGIVAAHMLLVSDRYNWGECAAIGGMVLFFFLLQTADNERHLVVSKFMYLLVIAPAVWSQYRFRLGVQKRASKGIAAAVLALLVWESVQRVSIASKSVNVNESQRRFARFVSNRLKHARLFFPGWWRAPDIQLLSGRRFVLLSEANLQLCLDKCYLLVDPLMQSLVPDHVAGIERQYGSPSVIKHGYKLYRITRPSND